MGLPPNKRAIPRVWEVDWAIPAEEGGTRWEAYGWLLDTAGELGVSEVTIVGATYESLGRLNSAIGSTEAQSLRVQPHRYRAGGVTVKGVTTRGFWHVRGPVLVAWAGDQILTEVEGQRPQAIAAVTTWPDDVATWRSVYHPSRIGQVRSDQEAEFDTAVVEEIDSRVADVLRGAAASVNENHAVLSTHERETVAGALIALHTAGIQVDAVAVRGYLMAAGWQGGLVDQVLQLAKRVDRGERPHHRPFQI